MDLHYLRSACRGQTPAHHGQCHSLRFLFPLHLHFLYVSQPYQVKVHLVRPPGEHVHFGFECNPVPLGRSAQGSQVACVFQPSVVGISDASIRHIGQASRNPLLPQVIGSKAKLVKRRFELLGFLPVQRPQ